MNGSNETEFMQYIAREYMNETRIYGIEPHQFKMYLRQDKNKTWQPLNFLIPYSLVKVEIVTSGGLASYHLFVASST